MRRGAEGRLRRLENSLSSGGVALRNERTGKITYATGRQFITLFVEVLRHTPDDAEFPDEAITTDPLWLVLSEAEPAGAAGGQIMECLRVEAHAWAAAQSAKSKL